MAKAMAAIQQGDVKNERGIPSVTFIPDVELFLKEHTMAIEILFENLSILQSKYRFMMKHLQENKVAVMVLIPEIERTLKTVKHLIRKADDDEEVKTSFALADSVYADAKISSKTKTVYLWLGANVMLECVSCALHATRLARRVCNCMCVAWPPSSGGEVGGRAEWFVCRAGSQGLLACAVEERRKAERSGGGKSPPFVFGRCCFCGERAVSQLIRKRHRAAAARTHARYSFTRIRCIAFAMAARRKNACPRAACFGFCCRDCRLVVVSSSECTSDDADTNILHRHDAAAADSAVAAAASAADAAAGRYSYDEADKLLTEQVTTAHAKVAEYTSDIMFLRDQITTTEVNMSRAYNYDVVLRKKQRAEDDANDSIQTVE